MLKFSIFFLSFFASIYTLAIDPIDDFLQSRLLNRNNVSFEHLPRPDEIVNYFTEDGFEDYLDFWLQKKYAEEHQVLLDNIQDTGCSVFVNSLTEPQPVYEFGNVLKNPSGTSGNLIFKDGESIVASCAKSNLVHDSSTSNPVEALVTCKSGTSFTSSSWLSKTTTLGEIKCASHVPWVETKTSTSCAAGQGVIINIGIQSVTKTHVNIHACFKESTSEALFVEYEQNPENKMNQVKVGRPNFLQGSWYPGLSVDKLYTQSSQKSAVTAAVGASKANEYITKTNFLARGHLAAKTDFILSPSQRATFTYINVAPQWQPFNGGNWNILEQNLRSHIGNTNRNTIVYTGTWGILKLKDSSGIDREIYLEPSVRKIPVPLWYYKVVREPSTNRATAFLGLNNPHVTLDEARQLAFCDDVCNGKSEFSWIKWNHDNVAHGFSICCDVNDFKKTVNHLPSFTVSGLFY